MTSSGTLAPYASKGNYSAAEKIVLEHFFTNVDKNVYCAKNTMSSQLWSFLVGQYSRTHLSLRDRFLQIFDDQKKALAQGKIAQDEYISVEDLAASISKHGSIVLDYFEKKSADFLKKRGVEYGHNSLKDADRIRMAIEGVTQPATKVIESPFPCLADFQETSTRYVSFGAKSVAFPDEVEQSSFADEIKSLTYKAVELYNDALPMIQKVLIDNGIVIREDFSSDDVFLRTVKAKVFDIARYLLPSTVTTGLGAGFSARTLESHLSYMLSHPLSEVRLIGQSIYEEAIKLSPGLLSHVGVNAYERTRKQKVFQTVVDVCADVDGEIRQGLSTHERVSVIFFPEQFDVHVVASILFDENAMYGRSYQRCFATALSLSTEQQAQIMEAALGDRGKYDRMPKAVQHTTAMFEFFCDYGSYKDAQRHRATKQLRQGITSIHGYEYPEYIDLPGMESFKEKYDAVMLAISQLGKKIATENVDLIQYVACHGHIVRATFEMDPGQLAYVVELRTTPQGHQSYRRLFQELYRKILPLAPLFCQYIRVGTDADASRKEQEEKAEMKRKQLGM